MNRSKNRDANKALHWMAIPLRSIATIELCRYILNNMPRLWSKKFRMIGMVLKLWVGNSKKYYYTPYPEIPE